MCQKHSSRMSAKKSWDIRPNTKRVVRVSPDLVMERRVRKSASDVPPLPLRARRQKRRRVVLIASSILLLILLGVSIYTIWQPVFRVQRIEATGPHAEDVQRIARQSLNGTFSYIIPRDSIFFMPKTEVRAAILNAYPDISAVSVKRSGFYAISINSLARTSAFVWCGTSVISEAPGDGLCYEADAAGFLFSTIYPTEVTNASTTEMVMQLPAGTLRFYAPLTEVTAPLKAYVANASVIPDILHLQRALSSLGAGISQVQIRGDEVDFYTEGGTRITYVLGDEANAAALAASAFPSLNLNDGSIEYVDLRFTGKVYYKRQAE